MGLTWDAVHYTGIQHPDDGVWFYAIFIAIILVDLSMSISPAGRGLMPKQLAPAKGKDICKQSRSARQLEDIGSAGARMHSYFSWRQLCLRCSWAVCTFRARGNQQESVEVFGFWHALCSGAHLCQTIFLMSLEQRDQTLLLQAGQPVEKGPEGFSPQIQLSSTAMPSPLAKLGLSN